MARDDPSEAMAITIWHRGGFDESLVAAIESAIDEHVAPIVHDFDEYAYGFAYYSGNLVVTAESQRCGPWSDDEQEFQEALEHGGADFLRDLAEGHQRRSRRDDN